jgi:DNA repair exonuclease SbcCD ATPase subunit
MAKVRLNRIEVQGFRSFGKVRQTLDLPGSVSVLWGGNSQGKSSFAEAIEFLFTGQIARRELLSSTKDEFAEALKNAHIDAGQPVVVEAQILCGDGQVRRLTRTLVTDYRGAAGCVSTLEIEGKRCTEQDIEKILGLRLSHPPLQAPVLAQHTLGYLFSATPTDRATYFRAILDTQDLEDFRAAVAALQPLIKAPSLPEIGHLTAIEAIPELAATAGRIRKAKTEAELQQHVGSNTAALLVKIGKTPGATVDEQAD